MSSFKRTSWSIFKSTSFISSFQTIFWLVFCYSRKIIGRDTKYSTVLAGFFAGLSVLWETNSRRTELALFCLPRNIDCAWRMLMNRNLVRPIPNGEILLFSIGMGVIMMYYQHQPEVIKRSFLGVLRKYFKDN